MNRKLYAGIPFTAFAVFVVTLPLFLWAEREPAGRALLRALLMTSFGCVFYLLGVWGYLCSEKARAAATGFGPRLARQAKVVLFVLNLLLLAAVIVLPALHDIRDGVRTVGQGVSDIVCIVLMLAAGGVPVVLGEREKRMNEIDHEKDRSLYRRRSERRQRPGDLP